MRMKNGNNVCDIPELLWKPHMCDCLIRRTSCLIGGHLSKDSRWNLMGTGWELINNALWHMVGQLIVLNKKEYK